MDRQHKEQARAKTVQQFGLLDLAKQRYIWTTEHITFEVETHLGQRFTTALQEKDPSTLSTMFRDDFEGQIPHELTWTSRQHGLVTQQNQSINSLSCRHIDAKKTVNTYFRQSTGSNRFRDVSYGCSKSTRSTVVPHRGKSNPTSRSRQRPRWSMDRLGIRT